MPSQDITSRVIYGSASAAARILTTSYAPTDSSPAYEHVSDANQACLLLTTSGTAPTSFEWKVQLSDDASTWCDELTEEVSAGVVTQLAAVRSLPAANGSYAAFVPMPAARFFRIVAKRTGGDTTTALLVKATFGVM
jgi:hypothetical protein